MRTARRRAALDVWLGILGAILGLESAEDKDIYLLKTGGCYRLIGSACREQAWHNESEVREGRRAGFFLLVSQFEALCLLVCSASHTDLHNLMPERKVLAQLLRLEKVTILEYSVSIGHEDLQHEGCGRCVSHSLRYPTYIIPWSYDLEDVVTFEYGASFLLCRNPATCLGRN